MIGGYATPDDLATLRRIIARISPADGPPAERERIRNALIRCARTVAGAIQPTPPEAPVY